MCAGPVSAWSMPFRIHSASTLIHFRTVAFCNIKFSFLFSLFLPITSLISHSSPFSHISSHFTVLHTRSFSRLPVVVVHITLPFVPLIALACTRSNILSFQLPTSLPRSISIRIAYLHAASQPGIGSRTLPRSLHKHDYDHDQSFSPPRPISPRLDRCGVGVGACLCGHRRGPTGAQ